MSLLLLLPTYLEVMPVMSHSPLLINLHFCLPLLCFLPSGPVWALFQRNPILLHIWSHLGLPLLVDPLVLSLLQTLTHLLAPLYREILLHPNGFTQHSSPTSIPTPSQPSPHVPTPCSNKNSTSRPMCIDWSKATPSQITSYQDMVSERLSDPPANILCCSQPDCSIHLMVMPTTS